MSNHVLNNAMTSIASSYKKLLIVFSLFLAFSIYTADDTEESTSFGVNIEMSDLNCIETRTTKAESSINSTTLDEEKARESEAIGIMALLAIAGFVIYKMYYFCYPSIETQIMELRQLAALAQAEAALKSAERQRWQS